MQLVLFTFILFCGPSLSPQLYVFICTFAFVQVRMLAYTNCMSPGKTAMLWHTLWLRTEPLPTFLLNYIRFLIHTCVCTCTNIVYIESDVLHASSCSVMYISYVSFAPLLLTAPSTDHPICHQENRSYWLSGVYRTIIAYYNCHGLV
jgi:hypothetical protein